MRRRSSERTPNFPIIVFLNYKTAIKLRVDAALYF